MNLILIRNVIKNKTILITGGTGSFGNSVVGKLLELKPKRIIIFSRDEKKQQDMRNSFNNSLLKFVIGDVRDRGRVDEVMKDVDYVFHAAALKQVPTCEFFPLEAIKTNVLGAENVISSAIRNNVKKVIVLSTDKAVYPINVIGMTKALMEKLVVAYSKNTREDKSSTIVCAVRYGNVLYTRGSVLPLFTETIRKGKNLLVTDPEMTRFLLPLKGAVDLVLYTLANGKNGYIYVRKSPACTIDTMAKAISKIFNYKNKYKIVGIRAGEKMHETLVTLEELIRAKETKDYFQIPPESQGLDYNKYFFMGEKKELEKIDSYSSENTIRLNVTQAIDLLLGLTEVQEELKNIRQR